jgi:N-carbamoylputrescine amidase
MMRTVALGQIRMKRGQVERSLKKHLAWSVDARRQGADLIVFPELSLSGYEHTPDTVDASSITPSDPAIQLLRTASRRIDLVVGFAEKVEEIGRTVYYNTSAYFSRGEVVYWHRKLQLVDYPPFSEGQVFQAGQEMRCFETVFGPTSLLICNDVWYAPWGFLAVQEGAGLLIYPAASREGLLAHYLDIPASWELINRYQATLYGAYIVFVNYAGRQAKSPYWGGSTVIDPRGQLVAQAPRYEEALVVAEIDLEAVQAQRSKAPLVRDARPELLLHAFQRWHDTCRQSSAEH